MTYRRPTRATLIAWTDANRRARHAAPVAWCAWPNHEGRHLCAQPAVKRGLCGAHWMTLVKNSRGAA